MKKNYFFFLLLFFTLSCSTPQHVAQSDLPNDGTICIITNPKTPNDFIKGLVTNVENNGFTPSLVGQDKFCKFNLAYQIKGYGNNLSYVKINVYKGQTLVASNSYRQDLDGKEEPYAPRDIAKYLVDKTFADVVANDSFYDISAFTKKPVTRMAGYIE